MNSRRLAVVSWFILVFWTVPASSGQMVPSKGTPQTLEVATWNIEWFGSPSNGPSDDPRQFDNVVRIIRDSDIDLWAVQEIASGAAFSALLSELGEEYAGALAPTSTSRGLGLGYVYKPTMLSNVYTREILTDANSLTQFAGRPPFVLEADLVTLQGVLRIIFINVHMKAFSESESYEKRLAASELLQNHIEGSVLDQSPLIILGDFNDLLIGSITPGRASPYSNFVQATADYDALTLDLQLTGRNTWCGNSTDCSFGSTIDQVVISNELEDMYRAGSVDHYDELLSAVAGYVSSTSDHLPAFALFDGIENPVGAEPTPHFVTTEINTYPNPFRDWVVADIGIMPGEMVTIRLLDAIGRKVHESTGGRSIRLQTDRLAPGVYLLEAAAGSSHVGRRIVIRQ